MASIFTRIINDELPAYKIAEDQYNLAFLDVNPNAKGHTLCVPKREVDKLFELEPDEYESLMKFSRRIAMALEKAVPCKRVGMAVIGLEVPHAHVHLIPISHMDEMRFRDKVSPTPEEFEQTVRDIREHLS